MRHLTIGLASTFLIASGTQVSGVDLNPGDIVTAEETAGTLTRIDPVTGDPTTIVSGGIIGFPRAVVCTTDNKIYVTDGSTNPDGFRAIIEIDAGTGGQTILHTFDPPTHPRGLAIDSNGDFIVSDYINHKVLRVDTNGVETIISQGGELLEPWGLSIDPSNGDILVAVTNNTSTNSFPGKIVRIDPLTGQQTLVSSGGMLVDPRDVVVGPGFQLYVADDESLENNLGQILRIDPDTGEQTRLDLTQVFGPMGLAIGTDDMIVTADPGPSSDEGKVNRVDPFIPGTPDTVYSSMGYHPRSIDVVKAECPWDCDGSGDGFANVSDLLALLGQYDPAAPTTCNGGSCDFDGNGCVDVVDLLKLLGHYAPTGFGCP